MKEHYLHLPVDSYYRKDRYYTFAGFFADVPRNARVLNVGCGLGTSLRRFKRGVGVDFNPNLWPLWEREGFADRCYLLDVADGLGWDTWEFDWTISTDFLEHVQPDKVDQVVAEIVRVAPAGRHVIDLKAQSGFRGPGGENLHPSANDSRFWMQKIRDMGVNRMLAFGRGNHLYISYGDVEDETDSL